MRTIAGRDKVSDGRAPARLRLATQDAESVGLSQAAVADSGACHDSWLCTDTGSPSVHNPSSDNAQHSARGAACLETPASCASWADPGGRRPPAARVTRRGSHSHDSSKGDCTPTEDSVTSRAKTPRCLAFAFDTETVDGEPFTIQFAGQFGTELERVDRHTILPPFLRFLWTHGSETIPCILFAHNLEFDFGVPFINHVERL